MNIALKRVSQSKFSFKFKMQHDFGFSCESTLNEQVIDYFRTNLIESENFMADRQLIHINSPLVVEALVERAYMLELVQLVMVYMLAVVVNMVLLVVNILFGLASVRKIQYIFFFVFQAIQSETSFNLSYESIISVN